MFSESPKIETSMKIISLNTLTNPMLAETQKYKKLFTLDNEVVDGVRKKKSISLFGWFNNLIPDTMSIDLDKRELSIQLDIEDLNGAVLYVHLSGVIKNWMMSIIKLCCYDGVGDHHCPDLYTMWVEAVFENQQHKLLKIFPISMNGSEFLFKISEMADVI